MRTRYPKTDRKQSHRQSVCPWTGEPINHVDWPKAVEIVHEMQDWLTATDDEASTEGLITADTLLIALDENLTPTQRVELILDAIGKLAFYWGEMDLPKELSRRTQMVAAAALDDLFAHARALNDFVADPQNLFRSSTS